MLIKEYRISLPMSVEEYRIAQLYMIQKKSREESSGSGSGVEILVNEPYMDGPGGVGQYTQKIYHIGSHLPGWFRAILPKSALIVEEEAWNAYPYTKTIYRCPFIEKFVLEIETVYHNDDGSQSNVFSLPSDELRDRVIDYMDIVTDPISSADYRRDEDPRIFSSVTTGRGPLTETWHEDYARTIRDSAGRPCDRALMCAYKLCKVEFRYWGMQGKIERFIHDIGLRKTMLRAHRQAWCWQDEYHGLTMDDIRRLEMETQLALREKMASSEALAAASGPPATTTPANGVESLGMKQSPPRVTSESSVASGASRRFSYQSARSRVTATDSNIEKLQTSSSDDEEYFDAEDVNGVEFGPASVSDLVGIMRSNSMEILNHFEDSDQSFDSIQSDDGIQSSLDQRINQYQRLQCLSDDNTLVTKSPCMMHGSHRHVSVLFLLLHGGGILDTGQYDQQPSKQADVQTFTSTVDSVMRLHYPSVRGSVAVKLVPCPNVCVDALSLLASLTPVKCDNFNMETTIISENFPLSAVSLFVAAGPRYTNALSHVVASANCVYDDFIKSAEGRDFSGQVCLVADSIGSMLAFDILCRTTTRRELCRTPGSGVTLVDIDHNESSVADSQQGVGGVVTLSCAAVCDDFAFDVSDFFMLGSPVGLVLAYRQLIGSLRTPDVASTHPCCDQLYNIFYASHPSVLRIEPLLHANFRHIQPVKIPRYQKFPHGDNVPIFAVETVQGHRELFSDVMPGGGSQRLMTSELDECRTSRQVSNVSEISGYVDFSTSTSFVANCWWGMKRLDYSVYCPQALETFPPTALPYLLHASLWESTDIVAFILRQVFRQETAATDTESSLLQMSSFQPEQPREKWLRRRTTIKLKNVAPNHRANDVIVREGRPQTLTARFMYGPLDVVSLSGEKVDIHIMTKRSEHQWTFYDTVTTDMSGRLTYTLPDDRRLHEGLYPVKMVVRGDHTCCDLYLAVLAPHTDAAVFSIDGSFSASVSIMGKDPKVRPGAVDVVRHWHDLGYLILYVTARPDIQQRKVVGWLAQHNFPHGLVAFMDGLSADPLRQKTNFLRQIMTEADLKLCAGYGSSKDIAVYQAVGLQSHQIFIVGKVAKKHRKSAVMISDGYAAHLSSLVSADSSPLPRGNLRISMRKAGFSFPVHHLTNTTSARNPVRKSASMSSRRHHPTPTIAVTGDTAVTTNSQQLPCLRRYPSGGSS